MSQQINLFNPVFLAQKKIFSARTMTIGMSIVLVALVGLHATQSVQLALLERQLAAAKLQFEETQLQLAGFTAERQRTPSKLLEDEAARLDRRLQAQEQLLESFASGSIGNSEGFSRYMTALARQSLPGVWITGFSIDGADGLKLLRGRLQEPELLPSYLRKLHREDVFRGQAFTELRMSSVAETGGGRPRSAGTSSGPADARSIEFILGPIGSLGASSRSVR